MGAPRQGLLQYWTTIETMGQGRRVYPGCPHTDCTFTHASLDTTTALSEQDKTVWKNFLEASTWPGELELTQRGKACLDLS